MDNRDIFDEADLLAIANDDDDDDDDGTANTDDSSSSVQFPSNIPSKQTAPTNHEELDDEHANDDKEVDFGFGFGGSVPDARTDAKTTNRNPPSGGAEHIDNDNEKEVPKDDSDDSDEDDDDGFLASWLETEKQLALATSASASSPSKPLHTNEDASNDQPQYGNKHEKDKDIDHSFSTNGEMDQCGKRDDKHDNSTSGRENKNDVSPLSPSNRVFKTEGSDDYAHHDSDNDDDDDDDDDENDVGFLESWSQRERHRTSPDERAPDDERPGDRDVKEVTIKEKITTPTTNSTFESTPSSRTKSTRDQTHQDEGDKCNIKMELGESILRWISNQKSAMANDPSAKRLGNREISNNTKNANAKKLSNYHEFGGVISIQQSKSKKNPPSSSSSLMRLSTSAAKHDTMGRSRTSKTAANVRQVILERFAPRGESALALASETTQDAPTSIQSTQSGQASLAPNPKTTLPGTMVDCLAIYDSQRGCYVLEIVDMTVSKLRAVSNKAALAYSNRSVGSTATGSTNNDAERKETTMNTTIPDVTFPQPVWIDPRSRAKRAEDQIRRLKRGKGKLSGGGAKISKKRQKVKSTREKDGKNDNLNSTGNDEMKVKTFVVVDEKLKTSNISKKEHL